MAVWAGLQEAQAQPVSTPQGRAASWLQDPASRALYDELDYQRAVQAYIWGQPLVGLQAMAEGARRLGIGPHALWVFDQGLQVQQRLQTGNDDVIYAFSYFNLKDSGPLVIEVPAGNQFGVILDAWQRPIEDIGAMGPDRGHGGKFLITPPQWQGEAPTSGFFVRPSQTLHGMLFVRAVRAPGESREQAVARLARSNIYPWSQRDQPPALVLHKLGQQAYDGLTPEGPTYFEWLARMVREEPGNERDRVMLGMLATLGMEAGRPWQPDARLQAILARAEQTGRAMVANLEYNPRPPRKVIFPGTQWRHGTGMTHYTQEQGAYTQVDERAALFRFGFSMQKVLRPDFQPVPGHGAEYAVTYRDAQQQFLDGSRSYRLRLPAQVPVAGYWSISAYDAETFAFMPTATQRPTVSSLSPLQTAADGAVEIMLGPERGNAPDHHWIQTQPGRPYLLLLRLFGPTEAFYAGQWQLGDVMPHTP